MNFGEGLLRSQTSNAGMALPKSSGNGEHREEGLLGSPAASDVWIGENRWAEHLMLLPLLLIILDTAGGIFLLSCYFLPQTCD